MLGEGPLGETLGGQETVLRVTAACQTRVAPQPVMTGPPLEKPGLGPRHWWPLSPMLQGIPCLSGDWTLWSFSFCPALCFCKFLLCQLVHFTDGDGDTQVAGSLSVRSLP